VHERADLGRQVAPSSSAYRQPALVERFIEGARSTCRCSGRPDGGIDLLPLHEIDFSEMPAGRPAYRILRREVGETSAEYRGTKPVPCSGLPADVAARIGDGGAQRVRRRWSCATTAASTFASRPTAPPTSST
jgi:hypothetical protein